MVLAIEQLSNLLVYTLALPLAGAAFCSLWGRRLARGTIAFVACGVMLADFVLALCAFATLRAHPEVTAVLSPSWQWFAVGSLDASVALRCDALSVVMLTIVTGVGFLIHLFSWEYQRHAPGLGRYYAALNFFCAAMLLLILSDSLVGTFIGWEGVGLCSYLLIGFDFHERSKAAAGKKAFIVNRIGDVGFLLGTFVLYGSAHTFNYAALGEAAGKLGPTAATAAALLFALAATGKSAQLPLFVWLPDAMAGPTPVSALIHAATMVTAGIYLGVRTSFLLAASPFAAMVVAVVGATTALYAASCALAQTDIKKVLAYSTVSQIGYMFMAVGMGAGPLAMFHVTTHAMFKACLFLGAGAVIHALSGEQDLRRMGGLARKLPWVAGPFALATLAISGVPPFAGFVSKDAILSHAFALGRLHDPSWGPLPYLLYAMGLLTAAMTAFYMGRLFLLTFLSGPNRTPPARLAHLHDAPATMALPLVVLASASVVLGAYNWPHGLGGEATFSSWLSTAQGGLPIQQVAELSTSSEILLVLASVAAAFCGLFLAWVRYGHGLPQVSNGSPWAAAVRGSRQAFGVDAAYNALFARSYSTVAHDVLRGLEQRVFEGGLRGVGNAMGNLSFCLGLFHSGNVQRYLAIFVLALAAALSGWLWPKPLVGLAPARPPQAQHAAQNPLHDLGGRL